jgi:hypothetical protein
MNIDKANTEPFYRFHRFHEEFNRNMRVSIGALARLKNDAIDEEGSSKRVTTPTDGEPWGTELDWNNLQPIIATSKQFISQLAIVRVMSAFEHFLVCAQGEIHRNEVFRKVEMSQFGTGVSTNSQVERFVRLLRILGVESARSNKVRIVLKYFVVIRNCIVHRSGIASAALVKLGESDRLLKIVRKWNAAKRRRHVPKLPTAVEGDTLSVLPRHAVMASDVCYRAAMEINSGLVKVFGVDGLLNMAAHHCFFSSRPVIRGDERSAEAAIRLALTSRYRFKDVGRQETIGGLVNIGIWKDCLNAFEKHR